MDRGDDLMARPSKYCPERAGAILEALRAGNTRTAAAAGAELSYETLRRWLAGNEEFRAALEKAEAEAETRFVRQIERAVTDGTWQAAAWWLERRRPGDWGRRERIDVSIRHAADRLAAQLGLDAAELIAEAERIVAGGGGT